MKHRLFSSLVLTGSALVGGCGATVSPYDLDAPDGQAVPESDSAGDPGLEALLADARSCRDFAWPTTKVSSVSRRTYMRNGRTYVCLDADVAADSGITNRCCVVGEQP